MKTIALFILAIMLAMPAKAHVAVGAEQTKQYLPLLKRKRVALLSNHTGIVVLGDEAKGRKGEKATRQKGDTIHTLDLLLEHGVNVTAILLCKVRWRKILLFFGVRARTTRRTSHQTI